MNIHRSYLYIGNGLFEGGTLPSIVVQGDEDTSSSVRPCNLDEEDYETIRSDRVLPEPEPEPATAASSGKALVSESQERSMDDMTKEWVGAKLEAAEARNETRLASMDAKLDLIMERLADVHEIAKDARDKAASIKWNVLFGVIGIIATVGLLITFGLQAFEVALALFQAGRGS